jgi:hypothetical protein
MFPDPCDEYNERERRDGDRPERTDIPFGTDAAAMDAEVLPFGTWVGCWKLDWETGELIAV